MVIREFETITIYPIGKGKRKASISTSDMLVFFYMEQDVAQKRFKHHISMVSKARNGHGAIGVTNKY